MKNITVKLFLTGMTAGILTMPWVPFGNPVAYAAGTETNETMDDYYQDAALTQHDEINACEVMITARIPQGFGHNCYADIMNVDIGSVIRFTLYSDNGYSAYAFVPPGHYTMLDAGVYDDTTGRYPFALSNDWDLASGEMAELTVESVAYDEIEAEIQQKRNPQAVVTEPAQDPSSVTTDQEEKPTESAAPTDPEEEETASFDMRLVYTVAGILAAAVIVLLLLFRKYMLSQIPPNSVYQIMEYHPQATEGRSRR